MTARAQYTARGSVIQYEQADRCPTCGRSADHTVTVTTRDGVAREQRQCWHCGFTRDVPVCSCPWRATIPTPPADPLCPVHSLVRV